MSRSVKENICILVGLMKSWGVRHVVVCPGSRNAAIVHTIAEIGEFVCHPVTDERSATFVAIGISDATGEKVAVCCTSGSAVLNLAPGVAEAYYRNVPLLIVTADRPKEWIGQMDGQTIVQPGAFGGHAETYDIEDFVVSDEHGRQAKWAAERMMNEAMARLEMNGGRPVHINIQLNEPLFEFAEDEIGEVRKIDWENGELSEAAKREWKEAKRPMLIIGQTRCGEMKEMEEEIGRLAMKAGMPVMAEHLANYYGENKVGRFDDVLSWFETNGEEGLRELEPDLVIYIGGHIVSKRVKKWLRWVGPSVWHVTEGDRVVDLMMNVRRMVRGKAVAVVRELRMAEVGEREGMYARWKKMEESLKACDKGTDDVLTAMAVTKRALEMVNEDVESGGNKWIVALANSSTVRTAQKCELAKGVEVVCNRGVNGIEGSMSEAVGCALASGEKRVLCVIGDLSFFYDMNALWNVELPKNLTILVVNNGCGSIFGTLKGLEKSKWQWPYVAARHETSVRGWAESVGCRYVEVKEMGDIAIDGGEIMEVNI